MIQGRRSRLYHYYVYGRRSYVYMLVGSSFRNLGSGLRSLMGDYVHGERHRQVCRLDSFVRRCLSDL